MVFEGTEREATVVVNAPRRRQIKHRDKAAKAVDVVFTINCKYNAKYIHAT